MTDTWFRACRALGYVALGVGSVAPSTLYAQRSFDGAAFAAVLTDCPVKPTLEAVGGGGKITLGEDDLRIPYGVPYRFRHRLPAGTDFALLTLDMPGEATSQRLAFRAESADGACIEAALPPLPVNRPVVLVESRGVAPAADTVALLLGAIDDLRDEFFRRFYGGDFDTPIAQGRLEAAVDAAFPQLVPADLVVGYAVLRGDPPEPVPVLDVVRAEFVASVADVSLAPHEIDAGRAVGQAMERCQVPAGLDPTLRARFDALQRRLRRLQAVRPPEGLGALYETGVLPIPAREIEGFPALLAQACPRLHADVQREYVGDIAALARDDFAELIAAIRAARRLVRESFRLTATEAFPGATTTLQRYGQLDVVNAFLPQTDEVVLMATFSFYPGDLRFGGEIRPHGPSDRVVATLGYSLANPVSSDSTDATRFAVGAGFRLNEFITLGGGRLFGADEAAGWYVSLAGDIGAIPMLRELFARPTTED